MKKRVVVIGAGTAGICAAKNALESGMEVVLYEQTDHVGGIWAYTDKTGQDEYGLTYGYMYKDLLTNVPKEIMTFPDLDTGIDGKWFLNSDEILQYLELYANTFNIKEVTKFRHHVIRVNPTRDKRWEVIVKDLKGDRYETESFDYVMVCNGHHSNPRMPNFLGMDTFKGQAIHSSLFRKKEDFKGQRMMVVGSASSAIDIAVLLCRSCPEVVLSNHLNLVENAELPENLILRPDVKEITKTGAIFQDDSKEELDGIIYCTGFYYSFPFLSTDCGIFVDDNYVQPLFKQIINIKYPSMGFIGLNFLICAQLLFDLQARFCMKFWSEDKAFPSAQDMIEDTQKDHEKRLQKGWKKRHAHKLGAFMTEYHKELADVAGIPGVPLVYVKIFDESISRLYTHYMTYRSERYEIVDDDNFVKT